MKKTLITLSILCSIYNLKAQEFDPTDAVQISNPFTLNGTARFNAMGGAFGALGGDVSSIKINPAGSAINYFSVATITGNFVANKNNSDYQNTKKSSKDNDFNAGELGVVFVFNNDKNQSLKKATLGFLLDSKSSINTQSFSGDSSESASNYFLNYANTGYNGSSVPYANTSLNSNESIGDVYAYLNSTAFGFASQQALLGYQSYILNQDGNGGYVSNMVSGTSYTQNVLNYTENRTQKLHTNFAFDFNNKLFVGANLNLSFVDYLKQTEIHEVANGTNLTANGVHEFLFNNTTYTYGRGFSFDIGALYKVNENLRIGASYKSPTWNRLNDEFTQELYSTRSENGVVTNGNFSPNVTTLYNDYCLKTPSTLRGSLAYIFGKKGLISIDYSRMNYAGIKYKDDFDSYGMINQFYKDSMKASNDFRIGGEYRIKQVSLRGGYRFVESPYKNGLYGDIQSISCGLGFAFNNKRLDFAYSFTEQTNLLKPISSGLDRTATIDRKNHLFNLTYSVYF